MSNKGLIYAIFAYTLWGVLPLYWHKLSDIPASEILVYRIIWSLVFLVIILSLRRQWSWVKPFLSQPRTIAIICLSAILLAGNWFIYIWAINAGFVIETSLGYFINPLVNVLLGTLFLHERLRTGQWVSVGIAAIGVFYLALTYGSLPWIALSLAFSFGFYGLLKKKVKLGAAQSLASEMSVLFIPALAYLIFLESKGQAALGNSTAMISALLICTGVVTAVPLVLFAAAARRVPLSTLGVLQYIAPTLQFLIGLLVLGEPFTIQKLVGFIIIWIALIVYSLEGVWQRRLQAASVSTNHLTG
jgi:chloramphenicol-sensitive protein RarD